MLPLIFLLMLLCIILTWHGARFIAINLFIVDFVLSIYCFIHDITNHIGLSL